MVTGAVPGVAGDASLERGGACETDLWWAVA